MKRPLGLEDSVLQLFRGRFTSKQSSGKVFGGYCATLPVSRLRRGDRRSDALRELTDLLQ